MTLTFKSCSPYPPVISRSIFIQLLTCEVLTFYHSRSSVYKANVLGERLIYIKLSRICDVTSWTLTVDAGSCLRLCHALSSSRGSAAELRHGFCQLPDAVSLGIGAHAQLVRAKSTCPSSAHLAPTCLTCRARSW